MESSPIRIERILNAPVALVWEAITVNEKMKQWYFDLAEFIPVLGFEFQFYGQTEDGTRYLHLCEITEVVLFEKLKHSWRYDGYAGISYVSFELAGVGHTTHLTLTHSGLESFPEDNPDFARANFEAGWTEIIGRGLNAYVENI